MQAADSFCQRKQDTFCSTHRVVTATEKSRRLCVRAVQGLVIVFAHVNLVEMSLFITVTSSLAHWRSCSRHAGVSEGDGLLKRCDKKK